MNAKQFEEKHHVLIKNAYRKMPYDGLDPEIETAQVIPLENYEIYVDENIGYCVTDICERSGEYALVPLK